MKKKKKTAQKDWVEKKFEISRTKDPNCLRSREVAHIIDCSPDDVIEFARKGQLKGRKQGRFWRFALKDVTKFQRQKERGDFDYY